jgi:hypothetical protein
MRKTPLVLALLATGGIGLYAGATALRADDGAAPGRWEYLHMLIPLDRNLETYAKSDLALLKPVQDAGEQGWELVSANEPTNGMLVHNRASVEFFFKRKH